MMRMKKRKTAVFACGFAPEEIEAVKGEMKLISLGSRILRTETAGFTTLAILMYHIETSCPEKSN